MIALTQAANSLKSERLLNCTLYVTIEPCPMCAGALVLARIKRLVFGAADPKAGACGSIMNILAEKKLNHRISVREGILHKECSSLLTSFFQKQRALGKK
jgi:tRNA(adenine34) deaminase